MHPLFANGASATSAPPAHAAGPVRPAVGQNRHSAHNGLRENSMLKLRHARRVGAIGAALAAMMGSIGAASAEDYPSRPITIVVPYAAGGLFDSIARALAESMRGAMGQTVVIENVGGAGGSIALGRVARATPDGYTLSVGSATSSSSMPRSIRSSTTSCRTCARHVADERPNSDRQQDRRSRQ